MALVGGEKPQPNVEQDPSKAKKIVAAGSAAVALVAGGVGLNVALGGGPEDSPSLESTEAPSDLANEPNAIDEALNPENVPDNPKAEKSEAAPTPVEPVLMTAETPEGLLEQYTHNYSCMINNRAYDSQIKCMEYMFGQSSEEGDWGEALADLEGQNEYTEIARRADPNYETGIEFELLDSSGDDSSMTMTTLRTETLYGEDHTRERYIRIYFQKKVINVEDLSAEGNSVEAWVVANTEFVDPGSIS